MVFRGSIRISVSAHNVRTRTQEIYIVPMSLQVKLA
jgi:hypothetical protein